MALVVDSGKFDVLNQQKQRLFKPLEILNSQYKSVVKTNIKHISTTSIFRLRHAIQCGRPRFISGAEVAL